MRKKVMLLLGIIVLSMFLFIHPIKADTEIVPIYPEEDNSINLETDFI